MNLGVVFKKLGLGKRHLFFALLSIFVTIFTISIWIYQLNSSPIKTHAAAHDCYWVGDVADSIWNDANHWSSSTGGGGGTCNGGVNVPGAETTVIFDNGSVFTSSVDVAFSIAAVTVNSNYSGTITQNANLTTTGAVSISGGTWNVGVYDLDTGSGSLVVGATVNIGVSATNGIKTHDLTINNTKSLVASGASKITSSGSWLNSGTFTADTGTVIFSATGAGETITDGGANWNNVTFNGAGGGWSFADATVMAGDIIITAGTLSGTNNITVNGGDVTGNGTINLTGGTFLIDTAGNFGGTTNWTFYNLTFGDGAGATKTTKTSSNQITTTNVLTIAASQELDADNDIWVLSGSGTPFVKTGIFTYSTSTIKYTGNGDSTITAADYYILDLKPTSGGAGSSSYAVTGSGDASYDGTYVETGVQNGQPYYAYNGHFLQYFAYLANTYWGINDALHGTPSLPTSEKYYHLTTIDGAYSVGVGTAPAPSVSATSTYTLASGTFNVHNNMTIGDGVNSTVVTATTNDPMINIDGAYANSASATFIASDSATFSVAGNFINNASATFTHSSGTLTLDGGSTQSITTAGDALNNVTVANTAGEVSQADAATIAATLTVNASAIYDINGQNIVLTTLANNGIFRMQGGETTVIITNKDTTHGTVEYDGAGSYSGFKYLNSYYNMSITGAGTWAFDASVTAGGSFSQSAGTINVGDNTYKLISASLNISGGSFVIAAQTSTRSKLEISGAFVQSGGIATINYRAQATVGSFSLTLGTFTLYGYYTSASLTCNGNFTVSNGIFDQKTTGANGTVITVAGYVLISGGTVNLDGYGAKLDVAGAFTLSGTGTFSMGTMSSGGLYVAGDCNMSTGTINITSASIIFDGNSAIFTPNTGLYDNIYFSKIAGQTLTIAGDIISTGNIQVNSGSINAGTYRLTMTGASARLNLNGETLYDVTITGDIFVWDTNGSISHNITVSAGYLSVYGSRILTIKDTASTILTGTGILKTNDSNGKIVFEDSAGANITYGGSEELHGVIRFQAVSENIVIPNLSYGGRVEIYNSSATPRTAVLGTLGSQTISIIGSVLSSTAGGLNVYADGDGSMNIDGATWNPTVNINNSGNSSAGAGGNIDYMGTSAVGNESISAGSGTWTVQGNIDFTGGTFTAGASTFVLSGTTATTGASQTITSASNSFNNLTIQSANTNGCILADAATVSGTLTDISASSKLKFGAGLTYTVNNITLSGQAAGTKVALTSTSPGTRWELNVSGAQSINYTSATDSDATDGDTINATSGNNEDLGNNLNWDFGNRYWVASSPGSWSNTANWSYTSGGLGGAVLPTTTTQVYFNSGGNNNCTINQDIDVTSITVDVAYTTTIDAAASTMSISGNFDLGGSIFTSGTSTLVLDGTAGQTLIAGGKTFNIITITNANVTGVTTAGSITTGTLNAVTPSTKIKFDNTATFTVSATFNVGGSGAGKVYLYSNSDGNQWDLVIPTDMNKTYLDVKDSVVDHVVSCTLSTDSANNNANWVFDFLLTDNLKGYWKLDDAYTDSATVPNNGTNFGSTITAQGVMAAPGKNMAQAGASFDGGDYVTMGDPVDGSLDFGTGSFSTAAWFKTSMGAGTTGRLISKGHWGWTAGYALSIVDGKVEFGTGGATQIRSTLSNTSSTFNDGNWHLAVGVHDATTKTEKIYVDGVLQDITKVVGTCGTASSNSIDFTACTFLNASSTTTFSLGRSATGAGLFIGSMDEPRVYSRSLTVTNIIQLYKNAYIGTGNWTDGANWPTSQQPAQEGWAWIESGTVTLDASQQITSFQMLGGTINFGSSTLTATGNVDFSNGATTAGSGTLLMNGTSKNLNGNSQTLNNLTIDGSVTATGSFGLAGVFTINNTKSFDASNKTITLSGSGTPFVKTGTFTYSTSTVKYQGIGATSITATDYYILESSPASGSPTHTLAAGVINVYNNLNIGNATNAVTVNADTNDPTLNIEGDLGIRASAIFVASATGTATIAGSYSNAGTFTHSNGTIIFDDTVSGKTLSGTLNGSSAFYNLTFNGVGGGWSNSSSLLVSNDLTMTAGTLSGTNNITVNGGDAIGNGSINLTAGTFLLDTAGNFGGTANWTFYNLTFGDGAGVTKTTKTSSNEITTTNVLTIAASQELDAANATWVLSGSGTPLVKTGTFTYSTSTVKYTGSGATNITGTTYNNLTLDQAGTTFTAASDITSTNVLDINAGIFDASNRIITLAGSGNPFVKTGTFTPATSTIKYTSTGAANIVATNYYNLESSPAAVVTHTLASGTVAVSNNFTVGNAVNAVTLNATANDPTLNIDGNLNILASAIFSASNSATTTVAKDFTNAGTFNHNSGTLAIDGNTTQTITAGGSDFNNLTLINPSSSSVVFADSTNVVGTFTNTAAGSRTIFNAGSTYNFANIIIDGAAGLTIKMISSSNGNPWFFNVTNPPIISYVEAKDSDASLGCEIDDSNNGVDLGNNHHWLFPVIPPLVVASVVITPNSATLNKNGTYIFYAKAYDSGGTEISGKTFAWSVIVSGGSIDNTGLFTAGNTAGTFSGTVKATTDNVSGYATVVVNEDGRGGDIPPSPITPPVPPPSPPEPILPVPPPSPPEPILPIDPEIEIPPIPIVNEIGKVVIDSSRNPYIKAILTAIAVLATLVLAIVTIVGVVATQMTIKDLLLVLINSFLSIFAARKKDKYGIVYDAETNRPVSQALVMLYDASTVRHIASAISDKNGHFIFAVSPGNYTLSVVKPGYLFPSKLALQGQEFSNMYRGQIITVLKQFPAINVQIPIDINVHAQLAKKKGISKFNIGVLRVASLIFGTIISVTALIIEPKAMNYVMAGLFVLMWFLQFGILNRSLRFSTVVNVNKKKPIDLAIVRVVTPEGKYVQTYVSDQNGKVLPSIEERGQKIIVQKAGFDPKEYDINDKGLVEHRRFLLGK